MRHALEERPVPGRMPGRYPSAQFALNILLVNASSGNAL